MIKIKKSDPKICAMRKPGLFDQKWFKSNILEKLNNGHILTLPADVLKYIANVEEVKEEPKKKSWRSSLKDEITSKKETVEEVKEEVTLGTSDDVKEDKKT